MIHPVRAAISHGILQFRTDLQSLSKEEFTTFDCSTLVDSDLRPFLQAKTMEHGNQDQIEHILRCVLSESFFNLCSGPGLVELTVRMYETMENDVQETIDALRWTIMEILSPFYDATLSEFKCDRQKELIEVCIIRRSSEALHREHAVLSGELFLLYREWLQSLFTSSNCENDESIWLEVFSRARVSYSHARRYLICCCIAFASESGEIHQSIHDQAIELDTLWRNSHESYESLERECILRHRLSASRSLILNSGIETIQLRNASQLQLIDTPDGRIKIDKISIDLANRFSKILPGCFLTSINNRELHSSAAAHSMILDLLGNDEIVFLGFEPPELMPTSSLVPSSTQFDVSELTPRIGKTSSSSALLRQECDFDQITSMLWSSYTQAPSENVLLVSNASWDEQNGHLFVTNYRLIFDSTWLSGGKGSPWSGFHLPILCISQVECKGSSLLIRAKDIRRIHLNLNDETDARKIFCQVRALAQNDPLKRAVSLADSRRGWDIFNPIEEFQRMGLSQFPHFTLLEQENYKLCPTYPRFLIVPSGSTREDREESARFRSHRRLPVVTWIYKAKGTVLVRCAQPLTGLRSASSRGDERIVSALMDPTLSTIEANLLPADVEVPSASLRVQSDGVSQFVSGMWSKVNSFLSDDSTTFGGTSGESQSHRTQQNQKPLKHRLPTDEKSQKNGIMARYVIMDARSQIASLGNQVLGKGTENPSNYPGAELVFLNIDNIHAVRNSFHKVFKLATQPQAGFGSDFYKSASETGWIKQVVSVLESACTLAETLHSGLSVLLHCSDGWDRTSQMCALAMLMLDPYYRTRYGFAVLIEKEWCSFGHKFQDRFGIEKLDERSHKSEEKSPIFTLFVDCVWQLLAQFPMAFEFNEDYLMALLDHVCSGRFGNFLFNSEKEREDSKCFELTESVWWFLLNTPRMENPRFDPKTGPTRLLPIISPKTIRLWERYYFRFDPTISPSVPWSIVSTLTTFEHSGTPNFV